MKGVSDGVWCAWCVWAVTALAVPRCAAYYTAYDNRVESVNNGRVNHPGFPIYLNHADDLSFSGEQTLNHAAWLGAYKSTTASGPDQFRMALYQFASGVPESDPAVTLALESVTRVASGETLFSGSTVYAYDARFPEIHLPAGEYLLSIRNEALDETRWLWACQGGMPGRSYLQRDVGGPWTTLDGNGVPEFAFSLGFIPEPSSFGLFCIALLVSFVMRTGWLCKQGNAADIPASRSQ